MTKFTKLGVVKIREIYDSITYQYFDTFSTGISCHTNITNSTCSVISNGQYKSPILLLTQFRSSHYVSSTLEVTYLLVHLHTIEIILFPSHSLSLFLSLSLSFSSFSSHVCIAFNFICNMHSFYLKHLFFLIFILLLFCSSVIRRLCTYV